MASALTLALAVGGVVVPSAAATAATSTVSGTVFRDFNDNGRFDTGAAGSGVATDTGLAGVTVTATDAAGTVVGTAISTADGGYSVEVAGTRTDDVRIEFSDWPERYEPSGTSAADGTNGTSVQFARIGATGVDFALNRPEDFAQANAPLIVAIQRAGLPQNAIAGAGPAIAGIPYSAGRTGSQSGFPQRTVLATYGQVGAIDSLAYQSSSESVFAFATYKRQSGLGSLGIGGIYRVADVLDDSGALQAGAGATPWLDVTTLGIDLGAVQTNAERQLGGPTSEAYDPDAFAKAGKVGFGGVALSADQETLYFINLFDKKLYALDVSDPTTPPTTYQSYDLGVAAGERPWALTIDGDTLYVGVVDSGEDPTTGQAVPGKSAASVGMQATVIAKPLADLDGAARTVLTADLGYAKGDVALNELSGQSRQWNTWTDSWSWQGGSVGQAGGGWQIYPQPILSGLRFDEDGYLTLGFSDRTALQGGNRNLSASSSIPGRFQTSSGGDLLMAAPAPGGTYTLERDGKVGTRTTVNGGVNEGPGDREFYNDRQNIGTGSYHKEIGLGSIAGIMGTGEIVSAVYDPLDKVRLTGLQWYQTTNGTPTAGYEMTSDGGSGPSADGTFQKGGGLGAVSALAEQAPVEIGNRVWFDADQDGVQDADEPAIEGVTVQLRDSSGTVIATTTTDADGTYYFRSDEDAFSTTGEYTVEFVTPDSGTMQLTGANADVFGDIPWNTATFTESGAVDPSAAAPAAVDSNADADGAAPVTLLGPGRNDHTIDAGYIATVPFTVSKAVDSGGGDASAGQEFLIGVAARDFRGDDLTLTTTQVSLEKGESSAPISLPVGAAVRVSEDNASGAYKKVVVEAPLGLTDVGDGYYRLTGSQNTFAFRVVNTLYRPGAFTVAKTVSGDFDLDSPELADAEFTVTYSYPGGGSTLVLNADNGFTATSPQLPYGAKVTLSETEITGTGASVGFGTPTWTGATDGGDGTATLTVGDGTNPTVTLTNPTTKRVGGFEVTKSVTGDAANRVPATTDFTVEYSVDAGKTWTALAPVISGEKASGPTDLAAGTEVLVREQQRPDLPDVQWGTPAFSGQGVTDAGDGTASFVIADGTALTVLLENPTTPRNGQFSVTKDVTGPGEQLIVGDPVFTVSYSYPGGNGELSVTNGKTSTSPLLPTGTVVTVTEVTPDPAWLPAGATWGTPVLTVGGAPLGAGSTITIGDATVVAISVENPTTVTPTVEIRKGDGSAAAGTIANEADTVTEGVTYTPGETRDIVIRVVNTGPEPLRQVKLTDATLAGAQIRSLSWTFPDGSVVPAVFDPATDTWSARWAATFDPATTAWAVGDEIVGTAKLTLATGSGAHQDSASVSAVGAFSGTPVGDDNPYNAFTGDIQVIKYDGQKADPTVKDAEGNWIVPTKPLVDAAQDANTTGTAVKYPVDTAQKVRWVITNTGDTWLTNLTLTDTTLAGPAIGDDWTADLSPLGGPADYSFVKDGPWPGLFAPGASFFAEGTLTLPASSAHTDRVDVVGTVVVPSTGANGKPTDRPFLEGGLPVVARDAAGKPVTVSDDDPFNAVTGVGPIVDIRKGDGANGTIAHEADTLAEGEAYQPGETRTIVFDVTNTGDEPLVDVVLTDSTISGGAVSALEWTLPDGTRLPATFDAATGTWTATWAGVWQPKEKITGAATLTLGSSSEVHVDRATVKATGQASGKPVGSENDYNAFTGDIQVIKYDGNLPDPTVTDGDGWVIPAKPLADANQDANTADTAVEYPVGVAEPVRWVVTNTGDTWLTDLTLVDTTDAGPAIGDDWTADLSAFGGPKDYSFVADGPWTGMLPPGASFFAQGTLSLTAEQRHTDTVDVVGTVVVPATGDDGVTPNGQPLLEGGKPVRASVADPADPTKRVPFTVSDDDPFNAWTGVGPYVDIEKGDGEGTTIVNDADTMVDGQRYTNGETRTVVFRVTNTGDEDLKDVTLRDDNLSGAQVQSLVWTLPDGTTLPATREGAAWNARWEQTFTGNAVWRPGEVITGTATLTLDGGEPHVDRASVTATGVGSGIPVSDEDDYNAFTAGIQVIKYDGQKADPAVKDADGNWIVPAKPLVDAAQDANTAANAVQYTAGTSGKVRWVVTNTGSTWLTSVDLTDVTDKGPEVSRWTADLSAFGGPAAYDFVANGTWTGLIPPGASFFAEGTLTMPAGSVHADTVTVEATPVVPAVDDEGVPTGEPSLDPSGKPVEVRDGNGPVRLSDSDPFHAAAPLATTGSDLVLPATLLLGGALLLVLGALAIIAARRRRQTA